MRILARLLWALRRNRRVRLHLLADAPSVEGVLTGRWGGHYILLAPTVLQSADETFALDGHLEVPTERVLFVQVLG